MASRSPRIVSQEYFEPLTNWTTAYLRGGASVRMSDMNKKRLLVIFFAAMLMGAAPRGMAQTGGIEFVARVAPSGGIEEPVRGFPFYVLSKSFDDIGKEVEAAYPKPDMDAFIEKLEVSDELKAWMKKNHWVTLSGEDFIHKVKTADVMDVPEFYSAYMDRNADDQSADFPKAKFKASDAKKNPAKFEKLSADYKDAVRHYIDQNPKSIDGIDLNLASNDPRHKSDAEDSRLLPEMHRKTLDTAESKYLVARVQTDPQGQAFLHGVAPGQYWLSTLDVDAIVGDMRVRWDTPLTVLPGEATRIALTNSNAASQPSHLQ